jgi:UDP-N-acetylglucosamine 3-dehydrogenase
VTLASGGAAPAAEVILGYPYAIARCASSSLMPQPYGVRGGWRATFTNAVLEYTMRAGFTGQGPSTLTEHTADGEHPIDLPTGGPPYAAMIDHVLARLTGHASNLIDPSSALPALELTLNVRLRLTRQRRALSDKADGFTDHDRSGRASGCDLR